MDMVCGFRKGAYPREGEKRTSTWLTLNRSFFGLFDPQTFLAYNMRVHSSCLCITNAYVLVK